MENIIIMTGSYYPKPMANGICVHQVALALKNYGYAVHVICFKKKGDTNEEKINGISVHRVKMRLFFKMRFFAEEHINYWYGTLIYKIAMLLNKFKKILYLPLYPLTSPISAYRYFLKADNLIKGEDIGMVISVFNPLETLIAGAMIKRKYKKIKFGLYVLDSLTDGGKRVFLSKSWIEKKGWQWERRFYELSDVILNMKCHEKHHQKKRYDKYRHKMEIVDIPLFRELNKDEQNKVKMLDDNYFNWTYTGTLQKRNYDPWYAVNLFIKILGKNKEMKFNFFSRGDCEEKLIEYERITKGGIKRHGFLESKIAISAILDSDVLISVGTQDSEMIPSKIFEYMSTGKPIIHFYKQDNDVCIPYYNNYPLSLCLKEDYNQLNSNIEKVLEFIEKTKGKRVNIDEVRESFAMNTPNYTAAFIDNIILK